MPSKNLCFAWTGYIWYHVGSPLDIPMLNLSSDAKLIENHCSEQLCHGLFRAFRWPPLKRLVVFLHFEFAWVLPTCRCASAEHMYACCSPVGLVLSRNSEAAYNFPIIMSRCFGLTVGCHCQHEKRCGCVLWCGNWRLACIVLHMCIHALTVNSGLYRWISGILEVFRAQVRCLEASLKLPSSLHYICSVSLHYIRVAFPDQKEQQISVGSLMGLCY